MDDKYLVEAVLGEGGMGVVLAGRHIALDAEVAIKVLLPKLQRDGIVRERFLREARAAATLRSSHVTRIFDVGIDRAGAPYIVMERLHGKDLEQLLAERGPLEEPLAIEYLAQACEALAEAHASGIVHRDLKPENLFVCGRRAPTVKVLDFGISKASHDAKKLTATAEVMGSPSFMSPEQFRSTRDVTARSDVWALGAVLYRALTGELPFEGRDYVELCSRIMTQAPTPIELRRSSLTPALCAIVRRCLEKDPMDRFANAFELREALLGALAQSKAKHRLAMAATLPLETPAPGAPPRLAGPKPSPWPSQSAIGAPATGRRPRATFLALGATLVAMIALGAAQSGRVASYVHPASLQTEAPAPVSMEPLDAPASMLGVATEAPREGPLASAKMARRKAKRGAL